MLPAGTCWKVAARCSDLILSQNGEDIQTALKERICPPEKIRRLGNGIDLRAFDPERFSPDATLGPPVHDTVKGSVAHLKAPTDSVRRARETARPRWIVLPHYESGAAARLAPLSKARAFMHLADHAFNYDVHGRRGFDLLGQVITHSDCFEFQYGALEDAIAVFDEAARRA